MSDAFRVPATAGKGAGVREAAGSFDSTYTEVSYLASSFAGLDVTQTHLQASPTAATSSLIIQPGANQRVVITSVNCCTTQDSAGTPYIGTLAASGEASDLVVYQSSAYNQFSMKCNLKLPVGKALMHFRVQGDTGNATTDANVLTVAYKIVSEF
jgi:hypothetical protein